MLAIPIISGCVAVLGLVELTRMLRRDLKERARVRRRLSTIGAL